MLRHCFFAGIHGPPMGLTMNALLHCRFPLTSGSTLLGIELGSTRIKAILTAPDGTPLASGSYTWENRLENGVWTYTLEDVWKGLQGCYAALKEDVFCQYGVKLHRFAAICVSAMMHGYLAFDEKDCLLTPFRTWRNTMTLQASEELTRVLHFHIPQRWSVAHFYQAVLNREPHVSQVRFLTTLAGYVHWKLTGEKVIGLGDASGMFPIDSETLDYDTGMLRLFDALTEAKGISQHLKDLLPEVLPAGHQAGTLTANGARLLDPSGDLETGIPFCPPEGDAGTGMVATNSVAPRTGNVSAGTSIFGMLVLEHPLSALHEELDIVVTPSGRPVAMVHCNNCTTDLNAWVKLFAELAQMLGAESEPDALYGLLYRKALEGDSDCGGLLAFNYDSGEHITGVTEGRPLFVRSPQSTFTLANFMRMHLYSAISTLKLGMDILFQEEQIPMDVIYGHGGLFKTPGVAQQFLADALHTPVAVMKTAGEGGAWGAAQLAGYLVNGKTLSLEQYLQSVIFSDECKSVLQPTAEGMRGIERYMARYRAALPVEKAAIASLREE